NTSRVFPRKVAKAQRRIVPKVFLCVFAPLRGNSLPTTTRTSTSEVTASTETTTKAATAATKSTAAEASTSPAAARSPTAGAATQIAKQRSQEQCVKTTTTATTPAASSNAPARCGRKQEHYEHEDRDSDTHTAESSLVWLRLLRRTFAIRVTLIDAFNTEPTLCSERRDVRLNRVKYTFAVVALPELRHESFALNLSDKTVVQVTFNMTAHLCEVLPI